MTHALGSAPIQTGTLIIDKSAYNPNATVEHIVLDDIPFSVFYPRYFVKISRVYLGSFQIWTWDGDPNNSLCFVIVNYGYIHDSSVFHVIVRASDYGSQKLPSGIRLCPGIEYHIMKAHRSLLEAKLRFLRDLLITAQRLLLEQFERERNRIQEQTASSTSTGYENNSQIQTIDLTEDSPTETTETDTTPPAESAEQDIFQETEESPQPNQVEFNESVAGSRVQSMESLTSDHSEGEYVTAEDGLPNGTSEAGLTDIGLVKPHSTSIPETVLSLSNEPESQGGVAENSGTPGTSASAHEEYVDGEDTESVSSESTQSDEFNPGVLEDHDVSKDSYQNASEFPFIDEGESLSDSTESLAATPVDVHGDKPKPSITDTFDSFQFIDDDASEDELNEPEAVDSENGNENYMTPPDYGASSESVSSGFENGERSQIQSNPVDLARRERSRTAAQNGFENGERSQPALSPVDLTTTGPRTSPQRSFENGERSRTATSNSMDLTRTDRWMEQRAEIPVVVSRVEHDDSSELEQQIEATAVENDRWMQDADDVSSIVGPNMEDDDYYRSMDDLSDYHIYDDLEPPGQGQFYISSATLQNQGSQNVDNQFYPSVPNEVSRNLESHTGHLRTQTVQA